MLKHTVLTLGLVLGITATAFGQAQDTPYQVRFAANLKKSDAIRITNSGANGGVAQGTKICASVYAFSPDGTMLDCCSCPVPPNGLVSLSIAQDVLADRRPRPKDVFLSVLASSGSGGNCNAASVGINDALVTGMVAWKGEEKFAPATLSASELSSVDTRCGILHVTANICPACRPPQM